MTVSALLLDLRSIYRSAEHPSSSKDMHMHSCVTMG